MDKNYLNVNDMGNPMQMSDNSDEEKDKQKITLTKSVLIQSDQNSTVRKVVSSTEQIDQDNLQTVLLLNDHTNPVPPGNHSPGNPSTNPPGNPSTIPPGNPSTIPPGNSSTIPPSSVIPQSTTFEKKVAVQEQIYVNPMVDVVNPNNQNTFWSKKIELPQNPMQTQYNPLQNQANVSPFANYNNNYSNPGQMNASQSQYTSPQYYPEQNMGYPPQNQYKPQYPQINSNNLNQYSSPPAQFNVQYPGSQAPPDNLNYDQSQEEGFSLSDDQKKCILISAAICFVIFIILI